MKETDQKEGVYNVITKGLGFINRVRKVAPTGAEPYLACEVSLLEGVARDGDYSNVEKIRMDAIVKGKRAREIVGDHLMEIADDSKVMAAVSCGGMRPVVFTRKDGEQGVSLKTALLGISWLKVNDTVVDLGPEPAGTGEAASAVPASQVEDEVEADGTPAFAGELEAELAANGSVKLSQDAGDFNERKTFIKEVLQLRWNPGQVAWVPREASA